MIARLERGDVSLTMRMGDVFSRLGHSNLAGYAALAELHGKGVMIQRSKAGRLAKSQPPFGIVTAGQLDLHVTFPLPRPQRQPCQCLIVDLKGYAHVW